MRGLLVALGVLVLAASSAAAHTGARPFTIRSSIDGKTVLPRRIQWVAYPSAAVVFPGVEFLVDGKLVFDNRLEPYAFGADGLDEETNTVRTGYLVTSWLSPGPHRFTVRAKRAPDRVVATKTVVARVAPAPAPPSQLAGSWTHELTTAVPPDPKRLYRSVTAQPGTYRIELDRRYIKLFGPAPRANIKIDFSAGARTITMRGPVWTGDPNEGATCDPWGPEAKYTWSVSGDTLMLAPVGGSDSCKQRGGILAGEWTRAK